MMRKRMGVDSTANNSAALSNTSFISSAMLYLPLGLYIRMFEYKG
jgi:hypothetical protein